MLKLKISSWRSELWKKSLVPARHHAIRCRTPSARRAPGSAAPSAGCLADVCKAFLRIAVALFVAPLAALITSFTSLANAQPNSQVVAASPSSLFHTADLNKVQGSNHGGVLAAFPESTGVNTATIDAVLSKVPHSTSLSSREEKVSQTTLGTSQSQVTSPSSRSGEGESLQPPGLTLSLLNQSSEERTQRGRSQSMAVQRTFTDPSADVVEAAQPVGTEQPRAGARASETAQTAADGRDRVQDTLRVLDNRLDNAISGAQGAALRSLPASGTQDAAVAQQARELVQEAIELVEQVWLDARGVGLDRGKWLEDCRAELEARPPRDLRQAHLLIKDFLGRGPADPYTRFIAPPEFRQLTKYDVSGAGVNLVTAEEFTTKLGRPLPRGRAPSDGGSWVVGLVKGSAADQAGVRQGDEVVAVDGVAVADLNPFEVASLIASPQQPPPPASAAASPTAPKAAPADGTTGSQAGIFSFGVSAAVAPGAAAAATANPAATATVRVVHDSGAAEDVYVARGKVAQAANPVSAKMARGGRGVIQLQTFNNRAVPAIKEAVARLQVQGATEIVLDLSDNRGGLVSEAVEIARLFLPAGSTVVSTRGVSSESVTRVDKGGSPITDLPLTVLVNRRSASASEILAGALRDNCRAVVAGGPTFGKGLIQSVYELADGSGMAVTVGKYLTPAGVDIDRSGISPDFSSVPRVQQAQGKLSGCTAPK